MPVSRHYNGHGSEVMESMEKTYSDPKKAERIFYATENAERNRGTKIKGKPIKKIPRGSK